MSGKKVSLGMEETKEMLPPVEVEFLRELYKVARNIEENARSGSQKWPVVNIAIEFTSPCEVNSMEVAIYEPQIHSIGCYLELIMKKHYDEFRVLSVTLQ